jgi:hypothetical protein
MGKESFPETLESFNILTGSLPEKILKNSVAVKISKYIALKLSSLNCVATGKV